MNVPPFPPGYVLLPSRLTVGILPKFLGRHVRVTAPRGALLFHF